MLFVKCAPSSLLCRKERRPAATIPSKPRHMQNTTLVVCRDKNFLPVMVWEIEVSVILLRGKLSLIGGVVERALSEWRTSAQMSGVD